MDAYSHSQLPTTLRWCPALNLWRSDAEKSLYVRWLKVCLALTNNARRLTLWTGKNGCTKCASAVLDQA